MPCLKCLKKRGNDDAFIESRKKDFLKFHDIVENTNFEKLYINKNEHLLDALVRIGINLKKGKGYKNYR